VKGLGSVFSPEPGGPAARPARVGQDRRKFSSGNVVDLDRELVEADDNLALCTQRIRIRLGRTEAPDLWTETAPSADERDAALRRSAPRNV
jgi:hypothetical protein